MSQYEFNSFQNARLSALAGWMTAAGVALIGWATLQLVTVGTLYGSLLAGPAGYMRSLALYNLVVAVGVNTIHMLVGVWTLRGARGFQRVVSTQGSDMQHLMSGLKSLRDSYSGIFWFMLISLALMLGWLLFGAAMLRLLLMG
jgi:hypothetical protein